MESEPTASVAVGLACDLIPVAGATELLGRAQRERGNRCTVGEDRSIVADDAVYIFLYWLNGTTVLNKRVHGYKPAPGYNEFWNADEWWVQ